MCHLNKCHLICVICLFRSNYAGTLLLSGVDLGTGSRQGCIAGLTWKPTTLVYDAAILSKFERELVDFYKVED